MCRNLTRLIMLYQEKKKRCALVFGDPVLYREIGGPYFERHAFFAPGQLFAVELWEANRYGTLRWLLLVLRAVGPGERATVLPSVAPGAEILFCVQGRKKVRQGKRWLSSLAEGGTDLSRVDPDYYRASHFKFSVRLAPRDPAVPNGKIRDLLRG